MLTARPTAMIGAAAMFAAAAILAPVAALGAGRSAGRQGASPRSGSRVQSQGRSSSSAGSRIGSRIQSQVRNPNGASFRTGSRIGGTRSSSGADFSARLSARSQLNFRSTAGSRSNSADRGRTAAPARSTYQGPRVPSGPTISRGPTLPRPAATRHTFTHTTFSRPAYTGPTLTHRSSVVRSPVHRSRSSVLISGCVIREYPGSHVRYCATHGIGHDSHCVLYTAPPILLGPPVYVPAPVYEAPIVYDAPLVTDAPLVVEPAPVPEAPDGWALLSQGQADDALRVFADDNERFPDLGLPMIGYALASALLHDDAPAEQAMRRAVLYEVSALVRVPVDDRLKFNIDSVIQRYVASAPKDRATLGRLHFMLAAFHLILHDAGAAHHDIDAALAYGDDDRTTALLRDEILKRVPPPDES